MSYAIDRLPERVASKIVPVTESGCWVWLGATVHEYGQLGINGKRTLAHRFCYEFFKGPIAQDQTIDHLCFVKPCVNPDHLEVVSLRENILRGRTSATAINARKRSCQCGHPYETRSFGERLGRFCRRCKIAQDQRYRLEKRPWTIK